MAFDSQTRNKLQRMVGACRRLLADEFDDQLQGLYGIYAQDGRVLDLEKLTSLGDDQHQTATLLRDRINHLTSGMVSEKQPLAEAVRRVLREQAFTVLNRFAALRMAEERGFTQECVGQGLKSKGFQVFETVARSGLGGAYERYVTFIHAIFDELSLDLGVLFDRWSPFGLLFPREPALLKFFELLNDPELKPLWKEDETVGWIYQYFNDEAERKKMREESAAPRNSRELAVRNQFFTPRYVVEFLTDNTLGRIWYEMTQGNTKLKEQCRYLVRRPNEIFLKPGDKAPEQPKQDNLSQEDLLKQPVHIPHRPIKDPRTILMLDPACGSMHFGLYAFDLFEVIYEEAWELEKHGAEFQPRPPGMLSLQETYGTKEDFLKDVPRLIIEHNLHGIDIDPRCAQIAGLSLWLRAQKAWQRLGLKPAERPAIKRSNIVCAEPMPGEKELLREFVEREFPAEERGVVLRLLETIFDKMQLAGEAGSLLKIEEEIRSAIEDARQQWQTARQRPEFFDASQLATLDKRAGAQQELPAAERAAMDTDFRSLTSDDFWQRIEERIYATLRDYAEQAENGGGFQRRLFAEDAARGFAFIDVCRKRYDVAVMNPPFGDATISARDYVDGAYSGSKSDIGMAFIACSTMKLDARGRLGAITNRVFIANETLETWRDTYLLGDNSSLICLLDLGYGILDDAKVEAAAFVTDRQSAPESQATFMRVLDARDKELTAAAILTGESIPRGGFVFLRRLASFTTLPGHVLAYQLPLSLVHRVTNGLTLAFLGGKAVVGLQPSDDYRFVRLAWEVSPEQIGRNRAWPYYAKGGEYQPYWDDIHLVVRWANDGMEIRSFAFPNGKPRSYARNAQYYFSAGVTYPERTTSDFSPRVLPKDCVFSGTGQGVFCGNRIHDLAYIAGAYSRAFKLIVDAVYGSGDASSPGSMATHYRSAVLARIPPPIWARATEISDNALRLVREGMAAFQADESSRYFVSSLVRVSTIRQQVDDEIKESAARVSRILSDHVIIDRLVFDELGFDSADRKAVDALVGPHPLAYAEQVRNEDIHQVGELWKMSESELIRIATSKHGARRQLTMKSYAANRRCELVAHTLEVDGRSVASVVSEKLYREPHIESEVASRNLSWILGVALGRWDIRYATGEQSAPELPDPFAPLPACPPGQLQTAPGLPARPEDVPTAYPIRIPWDGILVDDSNHELDIERRVREVIEIIWKDRAEAIEHEACEILGLKSLRDYFRKPTGFFADHLSRYSKSRRQAPIYWPLATTSGNYTLWIYYHRLTDQTLFQCVNDFVKPKLEEVNRDIERLRGELQRADGGSSKQRETLEELEDFTIELKELHDELLRVAGLPYKPNLNDGVLINASPLWKLFRLPKWQKDLKACWAALEGEEYEWAHLAYTIWPDRVKKVCKTDRSIAIAHGLEDLCEIKAPEKKAKRGKKKAEAELEMD